MRIPLYGACNLNRHIAKDANIAEMTAEAINRMKMLGLSAEITSDFKKNGQPSCAMKNGKLFPLEAFEKQQIQKMADKGEGLVYAVVRSDINKTINFIMVSHDKSQWDLDRLLIAGPKCFIAYIFDCDFPAQSETWTIAFKRLPEGTLDLRFDCDY